ncbi:MAG: hypothetical protein ACO331_00510 [Prochlorothrix sp.]
MGSRAQDLPARGQPHSWQEKWDPDTDKLLQRRYYGADGRAQVNVDYSHDHGSGSPHAHDWDWTKKPPRQSSRPLTTEEHQVQVNLDRSSNHGKNEDPGNGTP